MAFPLAHPFLNIPDCSRACARSRTAYAGIRSAAKARGVALGGWRGGPKVSTDAGTAARGARAEAFVASVRPIAPRLRTESMSLRQIGAELARQGIRTPRG